MKRAELSLLHTYKSLQSKLSNIQALSRSQKLPSLASTTKKWMKNQKKCFFEQFYRLVKINGPQECGSKKPSPSTNTNEIYDRTLAPPEKRPRFGKHYTSCAPYKRDRITQKKNFYRNIGRRSRHPIPPSAPFSHLYRFSLIFTNDLSNVQQRLIDVEHIH